ncbi:hypothetical protein FCM35_KLT09805 [Carex littledalei]|uniref:Disease resistance N-terminal domain-containing protein n=1 Tax=Carex littledalei TaxID=544730 RepID=A0A833VK99_9POAL|nr:hypothetical protein FCM35_KLT09805 [Carex littledalei]
MRRGDSSGTMRQANLDEMNYWISLPNARKEGNCNLDLSLASSNSPVLRSRQVLCKAFICVLQLQVGVVEDDDIPDMEGFEDSDNLAEYDPTMIMCEIGSSDIQFIRDELLSMDAVLQDVIRSGHLNQQSKAWMLQVLEVACDAELCTDKFKEKVGTRPGRGFAAAVLYYIRSLSTVMPRYRISKGIQLDQPMMLVVNLEDLKVYIFHLLDQPLLAVSVRLPGTAPLKICIPAKGA